MAVPFYLPEEEHSPNSTQIPAQNSQTPQISSIDNDTIVQAFYEALCRCSQNFSHYSPSPLSISTFNCSGYFWFPSPSTLSVSTPRGSFRGVSRKRLNSCGNQSQYSKFSEESIDECHEEDLIAWEHSLQQQHELLDEFSCSVPQLPKAKNHTQKNFKKKKQRNNKLTKFVISALQFFIDSLK